MDKIFVESKMFQLIGRGKAMFKTGLLLGAIFITNSVLAASVTLNMKGADINAVIGTVAEATGKNFIIDPRVKGKVTIISSTALNEDQLYQVFLAILDVHGFTAVPSANNVIKILPDSDAKHAGTPNRGKGEEMVTQVIEIKHIAAAQLVPILRPLVPPQGHLAAHAQTNVLIIADRVSNIKRLLKIIKKIDEPSGSDIEVVELEHASASEVVRVLTSLKQKNKKKGAANDVTLVADERTNSILMGGDKSERLSLKALIAHLDTPSETIGNTHVIYLRYAKAKDLVAVLTGVGNIQAKGAAKTKGRASAAQSSSTLNIQADESSNTLVITAAPDVFRSLQQVIRKLDVRRAQVLVEAIIAEISENHTNELGIQWFADGSQSGLAPVGATNFGSPSIADVGAAVVTANRGGGVPSNAASLLGSGLSLGIGRFDSGTLNFGVLLRALAGSGAANLLSTPNIVTMDNEEAEIFVGQEVSVPSGSFTQTSTSSSNPFTTFKPKQVGISLKVKPQINEGNAIKLDIEQAVDAITAGNAGSANLVTSQRKIKTSVIVDDGQIIVLGGLIADDETNSIQKVPFLGDIPLLGALFRYKQSVKDKKNLLVFIHPTIIRDSAVASNISNSKYTMMRDQQIFQRAESDKDIVKAEIAPIMPRIDLLVKPPKPVEKRAEEHPIFKEDGF